MANRQLSGLDQILTQLDQGLRTVLGNAPAPQRVSPAVELSESELSGQERQHALGLMRVNHAGEVCAQALYQGQALTAKLPEVGEQMEHAAAEEIDHLAWCEERIHELGGRTSALNPLWYAMSFGIGAGAGLISDKLSLGFVAATEDQVCDHLQQHLEELPANDQKSRAIVAQMLEDEARHAQSALDAGGHQFPAPVKKLMTLVSSAMTGSSYRL
ncbi:MAG: 2-polyprenyl-3-methyl-6-methoxy-1,4-benzoquinone monooxygenase [Porticoccaceae bacterium]|jgi:ubiquinone biosynthesis monooxygenase Coq7|nr:2-polyprenyl-3-methyl-6-methoxy-1,4-benzoquinone monooxygenase [Porticoccaceae bacterium]MDC0641051.1 2-polyprenyl-3-methyl-6-methoxy-1,4-benzoquinone monooxygenase [Porticoccaceae bacterium]